MYIIAGRTISDTVTDIKESEYVQILPEYQSIFILNIYQDFLLILPLKHGNRLTSLDRRTSKRSLESPLVNMSAI